MSTPFKYSLALPFFIITVLISLHLFTTVHCTEFDVGGDKGWAVPSEKNDQEFNDWASSNRFKVNDTLRFEYRRDSVLAVTEEEYEKCRSSHPLFFSNNGDTEFTLDRSGLFYFISGVSGHCERGLKMIVKVLEIESPPQVSDDASPPRRNAAAALHKSIALPVVAVALILAPLLM